MKTNLFASKKEKLWKFSSFPFWLPHVFQLYSTFSFLTFFLFSWLKIARVPRSLEKLMQLIFIKLIWLFIIVFSILILLQDKVLQHQALSILFLSFFLNAKYPIFAVGFFQKLPECIQNPKGLLFVNKTKLSIRKPLI